MCKNLIRLWALTGEKVLWCISLEFLLFASLLFLVGNCVLLNMFVGNRKSSRKEVVYIRINASWKLYKKKNKIWRIWREHATLFVWLVYFFHIFQDGFPTFQTAKNAKTPALPIFFSTFSDGGDQFFLSTIPAGPQRVPSLLKHAEEPGDKLPALHHQQTPETLQEGPAPPQQVWSVWTSQLCSSVLSGEILQ